MDPRFEITFEESPTDADVAILGSGLKLHSGKIFGGMWVKDLTFFLRDDSGAVRGGVFGNCGSFGWLYVDTLYVEEELRGNGYGEKLMSMIETDAANRGCRFAYLNTFTFQAPGFYEKLGYREFARLDDFPPGHSRVFLRKDIR